MILTSIILFTLISSSYPVHVYNYTVDKGVGFGRTFTGIGAISGGGATSKLLTNYPKKQQSEILDYLFKPDFGASLHIFKVEIGGDIQSTEGTEASHSHYGWDLNYKRGYEWWMLQEAKKRNPHIKLYALTWGFPGWLRDASDQPWKDIQQTANYVVDWVKGAKSVYNLTIDYIGIWNERPYNISYIKTLRKTLDTRGFNETLIIAADQNGWAIVDDIVKDKELADAIWAIGSHYPDSQSPQLAKETGKPLWASEDRESGGTFLLAHSLNQNYITGYMSSTILWNLVVSYYYGLPWIEAGLMTAREPWSGHYVVSPTIWLTAHTTQFTKIGWKYFMHNFGVGNFSFGGSYVTLMSPDEKDFTMIIETICVSDCSTKESREYGNKTVNFILNGALADQIKLLNVWYTQPLYTVYPPVYFQKLNPIIQVINGIISLTLNQNQVWTLTTLKTGYKGYYPNVPESKPFPIPYTEDFEKYQGGTDAFNFAQQVGTFEVHEEPGNKFLRQMVIDKPVHWCAIEDYNTTLNVFGDFSWANVTVSVSVRTVDFANASDWVFLAVRAGTSGCRALYQTGLFFFYNLRDKRYMVTTDLLRHNILSSGKMSIKTKEWAVLRLTANADAVYGAVNDEQMSDISYPSTITNGWVAFGTYPYGYADFDNFKVS